MRLIDADELKDRVGYIEEEYGHIMEEINNATTVDAVERKRGKWQVDPSGYGFWICSACGFVSEASGADLLYNFCPHCGADMRGGNNG